MVQTPVTKTLTDLPVYADTGYAGHLLYTDSNIEYRFPLADIARKAELASSETGLGSSLITQTGFGGGVDKYISYIHVDAISGVDNTGATSSTEVILSALTSLLGRSTSVYNYGETKFVAVVFGNGTYKVSLPLLSGVAYLGQGAMATRLIPDGGLFCFDSTGTSDYYADRVDGHRLMGAAVRYMAIGDYQEALTGSPYSGSGIRLAYASYCKLEDITIYRVTGFGLKLEQCWDSEFVNIRIMETSSDYDTDGESCGLYIGAGETTGDDGSNALRFRGLHLENCTKLFHVGKNSRHVFFETGCKFEGITTTQSCVIEGADSICFDAPELTWSRATYPMVYMVETSGDSTTSNRTISFINPKIRCPENKSRRGWFFEYDSSISRLNVLAPDARYASRIISGANWKIDGGSFLGCGPILAIMGDNCEFINVTSLGTLSTTTDPHIYVDGVACRVVDNTIESTGTTTDTASIIVVSSTATDVRIRGQQFSGSRQYAINLKNETCRPFVYDNHVVNGGSFGTIVYGWYQTYTPANRDTAGFGVGGVTSLAVTTVAIDATTTLTAKGGHVISLRAVIGTKYAPVLLFVDAASATVSVISNPTSKFSTDVGTSGDGLIHISQSSGTLTITNHTTSSITIYATGMCSLM